MNKIISDFVNHVNEDISVKNSYFSTQDYEIYADHFVQEITTSAQDGNKLTEEIASAFAALKQQGYERPILMGAIPFDTSQPSCLNVYANYQKTKPQHARPQQVTDEFNIRKKSPVVAQNNFEQAVEAALDVFAATEIEKVVLSQAVDVEFDQAHDALFLARKLAQQNPHAYVFSVALNHGQYLLGASPELLLFKDADQVISNPLAGSRPKTRQSEIDSQHKTNLESSAKDQYEHRMVVNNIAQNIAPYCYELSVSEVPHILETSTMFHLSSLFRGKLRADSPNALNIALKLHPTPAVCGTPTDLAKQFILNNEGYDRDYYAGLVGWMDAEGNGTWIVTIRCGLLDRQKMRLYAGAGIVSGSRAREEWLETEAKMQTMLNAFNLKA
ncbi:isochorismate synthase [Acinetobacter qingfengensis]|uniref:isochorismate synthase n=1 Tax=Acinetobacter qingfengensis TaxID=1262585 RepID=A0A1E7R8C2_9GAMM|nr:isochorismate synthase [Acinetobacter qingfengensis]KAA8734716.1 isochorismate synthase [Acinetobacter qingfengensis]OEY95537.1 hypothetical protein BJI46_12745 [Acinetobacter qingfengensis]